MVKNYKTINNVLGWVIGVIASAVFLMTAEVTVSFWDCGEYIATAYKLQVGHPPGAPTFQLIGCIFSHFAGDVTKIAFSVNAMSALCNGLCILFLFWSITMLGKKLALRSGELTTPKVLAVFGSAIVGSLAYTFTDTFWFSGVEGEVYAMSSFCTAIVFWGILKWDEVSEKNYSYRWIIFIGYVIGLSIGVHLLNLLTLPAMVLVVYFRKYKPTTKGIIYALLVAFALVAVLLWGVIPGIVKYSGVFERIFANSFSTGFYVGTIVYFLLIGGLLVWGLWYSEKKKKRLLNVGLLSLVFLLIGYSTFLILPIRSNANPPIDENNPEDAVSLLAYLNRDQYGSNPLVYGQYYNTPVTHAEDGDPVYVPQYVVVSEGEGKIISYFEKRNAEKFIKENEAKYSNMRIVERYEIGDNREKAIRKYDGNYCTFFPRMWNTEDRNVRQYRHWAGITRDYDERGNPIKIEFSKNLKFFFSYQMWYMYGRYFMWNFVGRQTLDQGMGSKRSGEWVSGIKFIDEARLGPQDMPEHMKNKGHNKYYFLPFILGLIGLYFQFKRDRNNGWVVMSLFVMTGIAIGIYLNMYAYQPRERDYAFAASYYAFAIWIGFGVYAIYEWGRKYLNPTTAAIAATVVCMSVPAILCSQNWDDHDRSKRYLTRDIAKSMLDCCAPNAILFTLGDNDTFPLWYLQEVEEYRTDVRICNLSLMSADWYIDQAKRKAYDGEPVPIKMTKEMYQAGTRDILAALDKIKEPQDMKVVMQEIYKPENNRRDAVINANNFYLNVDKEKVLKNGTVAPEDANRIVDRVVWRMPSRTYYGFNGRDSIWVISKAYIAMMDILAHNNWDRPIYFGATTGDETYFGLEKYFQLEGLAYRLVPIVHEDELSYVFPGGVNTSILYDILVNKYDYSQFADPTIFLSQDYTKMPYFLRPTFYRLAKDLVKEGKMDSVITALDKYYEWFPYPITPYTNVDNYIAYAYLTTKTPKGIEKGVKLYNGIIDQLLLENKYYQKFTGKKRSYIEKDLELNMSLLAEINYRCNDLKRLLDEDQAKMLDPIIERTAGYGRQ